MAAASRGAAAPSPFFPDHFYTTPELQVKLDATRWAELLRRQNKIYATWTNGWQRYCRRKHRAKYISVMRQLLLVTHIETYGEVSITHRLFTRVGNFRTMFGFWTRRPPEDVYVARNYRGLRFKRNVMYEDEHSPSLKKVRGPPPLFRHSLKPWDRSGWQSVIGGEVAPALWGFLTDASIDTDVCGKRSMFHVNTRRISSRVHARIERERQAWRLRAIALCSVYPLNLFARHILDFVPEPGPGEEEGFSHFVWLCSHDRSERGGFGRPRLAFTFCADEECMRDVNQTSQPPPPPPPPPATTRDTTYTTAPPPPTPHI